MNASTLRRTPTGCVITPAGIVIGGAYQRQAPKPSKDAEAIQSALMGARMRIKTKPSAAHKAREFICVYRQYRAAHGVRYSLRAAYSVAVLGTPF